MIECDIEKLKNQCKKMSKMQVSNITLEELSELTQALCKLNRYLDGDPALRKMPEEILENIIEEIADVTVCIEKIKLKLSLSEDKINLLMCEKIKRTESLFGGSNDIITNEHNIY